MAFSAKLLALTTSSECTVIQFFKKDELPKSSMKLGRGP